MPRHPSRAILLGLVLLAAVSVVPDVIAAGSMQEACEQPLVPCVTDVWIVSTRHLECPCHKTVVPDFEVSRWEEGHGWTAASFDELIHADPTPVTSVYVHGNRIEAEEVNERLWQAHGGMSCGLPVPLRMVFWSWPSDKVRGQLRDLRCKLWRSSCEAYYFAHFLQAQKESTRLTLIGYSYGARIVSGGLHIIAGGSLDGYQLAAPAAIDGTLRPRVVLLAPAVDMCALAPGGEIELAWSQAEQSTVIYNSLDPVLKRFWMIDRVARPQALGYQGIPCCLQGEAIVEADVRASVGRSHAEKRYFSSSHVTQLLRDEIIAAQ